MRYYFNMGQFISDTVNQVLNSVGSNPTFHNIKSEFMDSIQQAANGFQTSKKSKPKSVSPAGILMLVFGCLSLFIGGVITAVTFLSALSRPLTLLAGVPFLAAGAGLVGAGNVRLKRQKRFERYCEVIGTASFCPVDELAAVSGLSKKATVKDLKQMIALRMFPYARIDTLGTTLMLDEETYQQYLAALEAMQQRESEAASPPHSTGNSELDRAIAEGRVYLKQMNDANDRIPGEEMSQRIDTLAMITAKIFACVEKRPAKLPEIKKFLRYYLPTTLKLLEAYAEFDAQPVMTDSIRSAKIEIEDAIGTIETAFSNLLDTLYDDQILDISTDISVLESMFKKEGLTGPEKKQ